MLCLVYLITVIILILMLLIMVMIMVMVMVMVCAGISSPANTFISIAGTSIPLALMSAFNFQAPDADADDLADDREQNGHSSAGSTGVLRVYCTLFIALCALVSMLVLSMYKVREVCTVCYVHGVCLFGGVGYGLLFVGSFASLLILVTLNIHVRPD